MIKAIKMMSRLKVYILILIYSFEKTLAEKLHKDKQKYVPWKIYGVE